MRPSNAAYSAFEANDDKCNVYVMNVFYASTPSLTSGAEQRPVGHGHLQSLSQPVQGKLRQRSGICGWCVFVRLVQQPGEVRGQRGQRLHLQQRQATVKTLLIQDVRQQHEDLRAVGGGKFKDLVLLSKVTLEFKIMCVSACSCV